jgi:hypothetical protein
MTLSPLVEVVSRHFARTNFGKFVNVKSFEITNFRVHPTFQLVYQLKISLFFQDKLY